MEWINNKVLLYSTGNYIQYLVIDQHGKENEKEYMYMYTYLLEKAMAPHSSTLAWKIPWVEEPGELPSVGSHRVGHD